MATLTVRHRDVSSQGSELFGTPSSQVVSLMESTYDDDNKEGDEEVDEDSVEMDPSASFFVRALYDYSSNDGSSMSFKQGAVIKVLSQEETGWWDGLLENDERGWFPSNYVEAITEEEADFILAQNEAAANISPSTSASGAINVNSLAANYSGLGLGQDFDHLRKLMTGTSPMTGSDAFEQLAEEGIRSNYSPSEESTPTLNTKMASIQQMSPQRQQLQQSQMKGFMSTTVPMQQSLSSSSTASSRLNGSTSKIQSTSSSFSSERQRANTLSIASGSNNISTSDNRPRASSEVRDGSKRGEWVSKVTERGDIFYVNTRTGIRSDHLPEGKESKLGGNGHLQAGPQGQSEDEDESDESIVKDLKPVVTPTAMKGRRSSTIYMQRSDRTLMARRNAIENVPDPRAVPIPWIVRVSDDGKSFFYYNRQTHETSDEITLQPWDAPTEDVGDTMLRGPRMIRSTTVNSSTPSVREEEERGIASSLTKYQDEKDAIELQRNVYTSTNCSLQTCLELASDAIEELGFIASESIASDGMSDQDRIHIIETSEDFSDVSRLGLAMCEVVESVRDVLYASGSLMISNEDLATVAELAWLSHDDAPMDVLVALQSSMSVQYHRLTNGMEPHLAASIQQAIPVTPMSLVSIGKRMNATLSKVVLSTRSVIEQSFLNSEVRPVLSTIQLERIYTYRMRIRDESLELSRALIAFAVEAERSRDVKLWMKTVNGVVQSGKGNAGIGLEILGGGSAAGWRGNGFVLPTAMEAASLRAEANGTYQNPFELTKAARTALSSGKVALSRKPVGKFTRSRVDQMIPEFDKLDEMLTQFARQVKHLELNVQLLFPDAKEILSLVGLILTQLEDFDMASAFDVDGDKKGSGNNNVVKRARELLHEMVSCKQELYDMSSSLVMEMQDLVSLAQIARGHEDDSLLPIEEIADIVGILVSSNQTMKDILGELLNISEGQMKNNAGQFGARSKVQGIDNVKVTSQSSLSAVSTPGEEKGMLYLAPGLQLPDGPPSQPASTKSSTLKDANRARSTSIATTAASIRSRDSRRDDDDSIKGIPKGNSKIKKFFGDDAPDMAAIAAALEPEPKVVEEIPWFLDPDTSPDDILLAPTGQVKGGTLTAMVERLTMHNAFDASFNTTFLMTYRSFTSTGELLELLWARFCIQEPAGLSPEELPVWTSRKQMLIRFRIFNVLKAWLESHFYEGQDEVHLQRLENFVLEGMGRSPSLASPGKQLIRLIERRSGKGEKIIMTPHTPGHPPPPILPKNAKRIKFLDIDPLEMARQLTLIDSKLYGKIKPVECLNKSWSRDNGAVIAKGIRDAISANNKVSGWVSEAILYQEDLKRRAALVKQFLAIAEKCYKLNNYSSMMAIYSGLNNASLARLKRTWDAVNQRHIQMFERMREILSPEKNFTGYRESLRRSTPPCVPFLGVFLTDLTFIEDGNSDKLKTDERLINFGKRQMTADKIEEIMNYQRLPYNLAEVPSIQSFIEDNLIDTRNDNELYEQSMRIEPRERDDEKIARLLQESGFL